VPQPAASAQHNVGASRTPVPVKHPGGISGALSRIAHPSALKTKQPKKPQ